MIDNAELGTRLRRCRQDQSLTLKALESLARVSATHISEIERGRTSPTIGALVKLARALGKSVSFFLEDEPLDEVCHLSADSREAVGLPWDGVAMSRLTRWLPGATLSALEFRLQPGSASAAPLVHGGTNVYLVEDGQLEFEVEAVAFRLDAGDSLHVGSGRSHCFRNRGAGPARMLQFAGHRYDPSRLPRPVES